MAKKLDTTGLKSINDLHPAKITFHNPNGETYIFYWLDYNGNRVPQFNLAAGQSQSIDTFLTHPFLVTSPDDRDLLIYFADSYPRTVEIPNVD